MEDVRTHVDNWLDVMQKNERMHEVDRKMAGFTAATIARLTAENERLREWVDRMPKYQDDPERPILPGEAVSHIATDRHGNPFFGVGCARLILDDDFEDYELNQCFADDGNAEAALATQQKGTHD